MAHFLYLGVTDSTDTTNKVDLRSGVFRLRRGGYQPRTATPSQDYELVPYGAHPKYKDFGTVTETISLLAEGTPAQIMAGAKAIERLLEMARTFFTDPTQEDAVWLYWSSDGETGATSTVAAKRALIYGGTLELSQADGMDGGFLGAVVYATLAITRHPLWEDVSVTSTEYTSLASTGTMKDMSAIATGTAPSRIVELVTDAGAVGPYYRWWIGIRSLRQGVAHFDPSWEAESGTVGTDTTSVSDATASGGYRMTTTFVISAALTFRISLAIIQALGGSTNAKEFAGRYLVLARMKLSASSTVVGVQLRCGWLTSENMQYNEEVYFEDTNWRLVELGEVQIPPQGYRNCQEWDDAAMAIFHLYLFAERVSGSGELYTDLFILIPTEHLIKIDKGYTTDLDEAARNLHVWTTEDDITSVAYEKSSSTMNAAEFSARDWNLPVDLGCLVATFEREASHSLTDTADVTFKTVKRWKLYRS